MLNAFDVRKKVDEIRASGLHPVSKARRLVVIARQARSDAARLRQGADILSGDCSDDEAYRLDNAEQRLANLNREVMDHARLILEEAKLS